MNMIIPHEMNVDLHMHSNASDGKLTPSELIMRAEKNNVEMVSLTDHDSLKGITEAMDCALGKKIHFIPIEFIIKEPCQIFSCLSIIKGRCACE